MSAVAALAVASPAAVVAVSDLSARTEPPTQHRQFVQAAMITDLPNELMSALSQGLSQFGINMPPLPTSTGGSPGLIGDLSSMANQLGAGQAIDLLKGMVMPAIMSAVKPAGAPAADAAAAATSALPAAAAALPAAAPAIPGL